MSNIQVLKVNVTNPKCLSSIYVYKAIFRNPVGESEMHHVDVGNMCIAKQIIIHISTCLDLPVELTLCWGNSLKPQLRGNFSPE